MGNKSCGWATSKVLDSFLSERPKEMAKSFLLPLAKKGDKRFSEEGGNVTSPTMNHVDREFIL